MAKEIGFIGLGAMGKPMAMNLVKKNLEEGNLNPCFPQWVKDKSHPPPLFLAGRHVIAGHAEA